MEVRLPQLLIILLSIKHLTSIHINCTINKSQLDYLTDGFECEILNNLQIYERKQQVESISGEFSDIQESSEEYFYVEFGRFGESNLESAEINDEENDEVASNETSKNQSNLTSYDESDAIKNIKPVDDLRLAQDFDNEENYEQYVKNYEDSDMIGSNNDHLVNRSEVNKDDGISNARISRKNTKEMLNDEKNHQTIQNKISTNSDNFMKDSNKILNISSKNSIKIQRTKKSIENSPKSQSILADLIKFRENKSKNKNNFSKNSTNLKDMKENLKQFQKFLKEVNKNEEKIQFDEIDTDNEENMKVYNLNFLNISDQFGVSFEEVEDNLDNFTDFYPEDFGNSSDVMDVAGGMREIGDIENFNKSEKFDEEKTKKFETKFKENVENFKDLIKEDLKINEHKEKFNNSDGGSGRIHSVKIDSKVDENTEIIDNDESLVKKGTILEQIIKNFDTFANFTSNINEINNRSVNSINLVSDETISGLYQANNSSISSNQQESKFIDDNAGNHASSSNNFEQKIVNSTNAITKLQNQTLVENKSENLKNFSSKSQKSINLSSKSQNLVSNSSSNTNSMMLNISSSKNKNSSKIDTKSQKILNLNKPQTNTHQADQNFLVITKEFNNSSLNNQFILDSSNITESTLNNPIISEISPSNYLNSTSIFENLLETSNSIIFTEFSNDTKIFPNFTITSASINSLITYNNTIHFIPRGISDFFKNLKLLAIINSNLKEIRQIDLKGFPELRGLWLPYNDIEVIEWHLFDFNPNLVEINLMENQIKIINLDAFDRVPQLGQLDLLRNVCVDKAAYDVEETKLLLDDLRENCETVGNSLLEKYESYYVISLGVIALLCTIIAFYACLKKFSK